jgi:Xaa-Pro aminopeptidase
MKRLCLTLVLFAGCFAQPSRQPPKPADDPSLPAGPASPEQTLPNGKKQRDMIVKDDYQKNLADSAQMTKLAEDLKAELESGDKYIVSVKAIKQAEEIEKLARNIRTRLKRY